jgi:creatinine amidohydrolase
MMLPKRDWTEMTRQDFAGADTARWIAVLPLAAVEQHGPHLPLEVDVFIAEAYLARTRKLIPAELPVTLLPVQRIGLSQEHVAFPGTRTLSAETAIGDWTELGDSLHGAGVRKLVLITSHGGNSAVMDIVARDLRTRNGMLVVTCAWHRFSYPEGLFSAEEQRHGIHGGEIETSLMLAARPDTVHMEKAENFIPATVAMEKEFRWLNAFRPAGFGWMAQDLHPSGAVGNAKAATAVKGQAALDHGARAFVELLKEVDRFDLARLGKGPLGDAGIVREGG